MKVTQGELARILGVSKRTIRNYQEHGMPREGRRNSRQYDTRDCLEWWAANRLDRAPDSGEGEDLPPVEESDRRWRRARAQLKEQEVRERRGSLIPFSDVREIVLETAERIRRRLLNLPGRRVRELSAATDPARVKKIRDEAVREILADMEEEFAAAAEEER